MYSFIVTDLRPDLKIHFVMSAKINDPNKNRTINKLPHRLENMDKDVSNTVKKDVDKIKIGKFIWQDGIDKDIKSDKLHINFFSYHNKN